MERQWTSPKLGRNKVGVINHSIYFYYEVETGVAISRVEDNVDHSTATILRDYPMLFVGPDHMEKAKRWVERRWVAMDEDKTKGHIKRTVDNQD